MYRSVQLLIIVFFAIISTTSTYAQRFRNIVKIVSGSLPESIKLIAKEIVHGGSYIVVDNTNTTCYNVVQSKQLFDLSETYLTRIGSHSASNTSLCLNVKEHESLTNTPAFVMVNISRNLCGIDKKRGLKYFRNNQNIIFNKLYCGELPC